MKRTKPRILSAILVAAFVVAAVVIGVLMLNKYHQSKQIPTVQPELKPAGTFLVTLFFATPDADGLVREGREVDACEDVAECIEAVVDELVNGPVGDLQPTLPPNAVVHGVRVEGDMAVIDFGHELADSLPGGSSAEMAALYSVVNTVCLNFPQVKRVKFLIDGKEAETLKEHLDLRQPVVPDLTLEKAAAPQPSGTQPNPEKVVKP
ncbi:MAG: sporulation protein [Desulfuromonadales bacterium]|nr:MAG: sporulation protein [Desulfuromonadales bacterium]